MRTSELTGAALDWAVAKCEGGTNLRYDTVACWWFTLDGEDRVLSRGWSVVQNFAPSADWAQGGPIIERENLDVCIHIPTHQWCSATQSSADRFARGYGPTPLIAAMRCYVASKLGDEIGIPRGLTK